MCFAGNSTANGARRDSVKRPYYVRSARCTVHGTRTHVITFTVVRNILHFLRLFLCNTQVPIGTVCGCRTEFYTKRAVNVKSTDTK